MKKKNLPSITEVFLIKLSDIYSYYYYYIDIKHFSRFLLISYRAFINNGSNLYFLFYVL